jgi:SAM-dependent methyltransferase
MVPWYVKVAGKIVLSRLPVSHSVWFKLGVFRHGQMQEIDYARKVFETHLRLAGLTDPAHNSTKTVMELGPGESLFTAVLARAYGFAGATLADVGDFSAPSGDRYKELARRLARDGASLPDLSDCADTAAILDRLGARYLTQGLQSLKAIPDGSVDFIFSHAVLEHVRRADFVDTLREMRRVLAPGGVCTHVIDLKDHLQASLNNLRFGEDFWESSFISSSGFYTNRFRFDELIQMFSAAGFEVDVVSKDEWPALPVPRSSLTPHFQAMPEASLRVSDATVRLM